MLREADGAEYLLLLNADPLGGDTEGDANGEIPPSSLVGGLVLLVDSSTTDDGDVDVAREDSDGLDSDDEEDHGSLGRIVGSLTPGLQRVARRVDGVDCGSIRSRSSVTALAWRAVADLSAVQAACSICRCLETVCLC